MKLMHPLRLVLCLLPFSTAGQQVINLRNPSFEMDKPACCVEPAHWTNLGDEFESPTDIQPGQFGVNIRAQNGERYVSMVVRDNNTVEGIGQKLAYFLEKDSTYAFSVWLARPARFESLSRLTQQPANYVKACVLQVRGTNTETGAAEILAESVPVTHTTWELYEFKLKPSRESFNRLDLVANYEAGVAEPYNGGLLVDNLSAITQIFTNR